jgi:hypothetical protein
MTSRFLLRLATLAIALCVAVPATALVVRATIYFAANFNASGAPGPMKFNAEIGTMETTGPDGVFSLVSGPTGGMVRIAGGGLASDATLRAKLKKVFKGTEVTIHFQITASQKNSTLTMRAEDDADSGMIDVSFDGSGGIKVDGADSGEAYAQGATYDGKLRLRDSVVGASTWYLSLVSDSGEVILLQGQMKSSAPLRLDEVVFIRAAGGAPGEFFLDDVKVTSNTLLSNY